MAAELTAFPAGLHISVQALLVGEDWAVKAVAAEYGAVQHNTGFADDIDHYHYYIAPAQAGSGFVDPEQAGKAP